MNQKTCKLINQAFGKMTRHQRRRRRLFWSRLSQKQRAWYRKYLEGMANARAGRAMPDENEMLTEAS